MAQPKQIFLSYGRRDAADLAEEITNFLTSKGYRVWRDRPAIKPGTPFLEVIEKAIRKSDLVIALLSPHSVRRVGDTDSLDSVCLDELSLARFTQPPTPILPILAVKCEPPMVIYRLDYVDFTNGTTRNQDFLRLQDGVDLALAGKVKLRSWISGLQPWDFEPFLQAKRRNFIGRKWLLAKVSNWLVQGHTEPALLLKGDPGSGKSAFIAHLIESNPVSLLAYHCCQANIMETLKPSRFVRNIAATLASRLPAYEVLMTGLVSTVLSESHCENDPYSAFAEGILAPLSTISYPRQEPAYILIDALDEALLIKDKTAGITIVDLLADQLRQFPSWLRIVATTRKEDTVLRKLRGIRHTEIEVYSDENLNDVEEFVISRFSEPRLKKIIGESSTDLESIVKKLKGAANFLYVTETINEIEREQRKLEDLETLPGGLYGIYENFFDRTFPINADPSTLKSVKTLLSIMLAAQDQFTENQLAEISGFDQEYELPSMLKTLSPYLSKRIDLDGKANLGIYHKSFSDWLQDEDLRGTRYYTSTKSGHQLLANKFLDEYTQGITKISSYFLNNGTFHLGLAGKRDLLIKVLTDPEFVLYLYKELGIAQLSRMYEHAISIHPTEAHLRPLTAILSALRLSVSSLIQAPDEFAVQLEVRLRDIEELTDFRTTFSKRIPDTVLIPKTNPLTPALSALIFSLKTGFAVGAVGVFEQDNLAITGDEDGVIRVWDLSNGLPLISVDLNLSGFTCCAIDPKQPVAAFGTYDTVIVLFDIETGEAKQISTAKFGDVQDMQLDSKRKHLFSVHKKYLVSWTWPSCELNWYKEYEDYELQSLRLGNDQQSIFLLSKTQLLKTDIKGEQAITLRNAPPLKEFDPWHQRSTLFYSALDLHQDNTVALGLDDGTIQLVDSATGNLNQKLPGHPIEFYHTSISNLQFIGKDQLVSAGWDNAIRIWNIHSGEELCSFRSTSKIYDFKVFNNGQKAIAGHKMLQANIWDLTVSNRISKESGFVGSLKVSNSLGIAIGIINNFQVGKWNIVENKVSYFTLKDRIISLGLNEEKKEFLVLTENGIKVFKIEEIENKGRVLSKFKTDWHRETAWSPDGNLLAVYGYRKMTIWHRNKEQISLDLPDKFNVIYSLCLSNSKVAIASSKQVQFYEYQDIWTPALNINLEMSVHSMTFSPDGKCLSICSEAGDFVGYDSSDGAILWQFKAIKAEYINDHYLTNSGYLCLIVEEELSVYNVQTGQRLASFHSENKWKNCWLSEDSKSVFAGSSEGELHHLSRNTIDA